jgi:uncharacterized protein
MTHLLVHVTCGPEDPSRAALAFLVAKAALEAGHEVSVFLATDAVQLLRDPVLDSLVGVGTGRLRDHLDGVVAGGGRLHVSALSSQARGVTETDLDGKSAEFATPARLVALTFEADRVLTY